MIEKSDSISLALATIAIPGQAPMAVSGMSMLPAGCRISVIPGHPPGRVVILFDRWAILSLI
jgi:hypothetical protein